MLFQLRQMLARRLFRLFSVQTTSQPPKRVPRPSESEEARRARLIYQSRKRGILETDLLLSTFAEQHLRTCDDAFLKEYDRLLDENDWDIYYWSVGEKPIPEEFKQSPALKMLVEHAKNDGRRILRMPDLNKKK